MSKILFINGGSRSFGERFRKSCKDTGLECVSIRGVHTSFFVRKGEVEVWHKGEKLDLESIQYAFVRVRGKVPHTVSLLLHVLSHYGISYNDVINREHTESGEKVTQMVRLALSGIPIPQSILFNKTSFESNKEIIVSKIKFPCVLKTGGSKGDAVWKINSLEEMEGKINGVDKELMFLQEYIKNDFDIRVLCLYGDILGAIKRSSNDGFYNNIAQGGRSEKIEITEEEEELSETACQILKVDFGGVDIVRGNKGPLIFEVNTGPQVYGFEEATGINISKMIVEKIKEKFFNQ